jgi:hypothetical protein
MSNIPPKRTSLIQELVEVIMCFFLFELLDASLGLLEVLGLELLFALLGDQLLSLVLEVG